jgi:SlyX protein
MTDYEIPEEIEERFQTLENKVLYQDRTIDELNTVVTRQQDQVDQLIAEVRKLREFFKDLPEGTIDGAEEPPPPHY